jgi:cytidyltransferase-like protein
MAKIEFKDLRTIRERHKDQKIVFCSGGFDLTHAGHVLFFEDAKKQGDVLVVLVGSDKAVKRDKGPARPILNEHMRIKLVDSLKPVDYTMTDELTSPDKHALHYLDMVFEELRPDVYVANEDAFDIPYRKIFSEKHNAKLVVLKRWSPPEFETISTTKIIGRVKERQQEK